MTDDAPFFQLGEPQRGGIVAVADHASNRVPHGIDLGVPDHVLKDHVAVDIGTDQVVRRLAPDHGMAAHIANVSRLVIDFHREEDHPGLLPTTSDGHTIHGNIEADLEERLNRFYRPYHNALDEWLDRAEPSLIVSLHSFTPQLATSEDARPWEVGLLYNQDDRGAQLAMRAFREMGLNVGDNEPYSGKLLNATMNRHAEAHDRPYMFVEVRNDLIRDAAGQQAWAKRVADVAHQVAKKLG